MRSLRIAASFAALLLLARAACGLDPGDTLAQYGHTAWHVRDGAFAGTPSAIAQTRDGFLWIGTQAGLMRFDGVRFLPFKPPPGTHLPDDRIMNLLGTSDGSLWIGTANGLARWHDGQLVVHARAGRFSALAEDRQGTVWAGHTRALSEVPPLCRFAAGEFRCIRFADEYRLRYIGALHVDRRGELWMGGEAGVCRYRPGTPECFVIAEVAALENKSGIFTLADDADGNLWAGSNDLGTWRLAAGRWTRPPGLPTAVDGGPLFCGRDGGLWTGTGARGLLRLARGRIERFSRFDGLSDDIVNQLFEDREGNVWAATPEGLDRFRDAKVVTPTSPENMLGGYVSAVTPAREGGLWIAEGSSLIRWTEGGISIFDADQGLPGNALTSLREDSRGRLWLGVDNGLAWFEHGRFSPFRMPDGSPLGIATSIVEARDGDLWVALATTDPGRALIRIRDARVAQVFPSSLFGGRRINALAADPESGVWLGLGNGGLARYRNGRFEAHGRAVDPAAGRIHDLLAEPRGLWVATSRGLVLLRQGKLQLLDSRGGLPCDEIETVASGSDGALWVRATCGLVRILPAEIAAWLDHPERRVEVRVFDALDGVRTGLSPFTPRAARTPDGRLWFALEKAGMQVVDPRRLGENPLPPPVEILGVVADRQSYEPSARLRLPPLTRDLEIDYTALSLSMPEKVRFRYRLEGVDRDWQEAGTRRAAFYTHPGPGAFRFRVVACNNDGVWNREGATLAFVIAPAFYQTGWFVLLATAAVAGLAWAGYRWRVQQVTARLDLQFEERLAERTRIAQELHDTLLQGFLSASMQLHVAVDALPQDAPERPRFARVLELMGQVTEEGRNALRGFRKPAPQAFGSDDLGLALSQIPRELGNPEGIGFRVLVEGHPRPLHPVIRDEVYRIGREALVNAFRHAGAGDIEVEIEYAAKALRVLVRDDGRGIDPEVLHAGREGHWGLSGMRERAEAMGARLKVWSRAGAGTEVELAVPGKIAFAGGPPARRKRRWPRWLRPPFRLHCAVFASLLLFASAARGLDPALTLGQYGHTAWRSREGSFAGSPAALAQTRDGFLWFGTENGLIRFDGARFMPWEPPAGTHLPDDRIISLLGASDGSLWVGTANGLARWQGGKLAVYARQGRFGALLEDRQGTVWAGHTRALSEVPPLCRFRRGEWRCFRFADPLRLPYVGALHEDRQGNLWIGGKVGICRFRPDKPDCYDLEILKTLGDKAGVFALADDAQGNLWAMTSGEGTWRFQAGRWTRYPGPPGSAVRNGPILFDREGGLWFGTDSGVLRLVQGRTETFSRTDGLSGDGVNQFFEDREGNVWAATSSGLDRFRDVKIAVPALRERTPGDVVSMAAARDGGLWIAEQATLLRWGEAGVKVYEAGRDLPGHSLTSLCEDSRRRIWVGLDNGLAFGENGRFLPLRMPDGSAVGVVTSMAADGGDLWVATTIPSHALLRVRDDRVVEALAGERLGDRLVVATAADPRGGVWLGLGNGALELYRNGRLESHGSTGGESRIQGLLADARGLWAATHRGLGLLRQGSFHLLDTGNGLPCNDIAAVLPGDDGGLWLHATCGLVRVPAGELAAWADHPQRRVAVRVFDAFDGVQNGRSPFTPRAARSLDGRLWLLAEDGGLQGLDPRRIPGNRIPPPVEILRMVADHEAYAPAPGFRLPPLTRDLEIDYTALSLTVPEKVRFRYRLLGVDRDWQEAGTRREAFYTNLRPGSYRFRVAACNNDGVWSPTGATLAFAILPAFYQTRWFLLLVAATTGSLAWAGYRWRVRQVTSRLDLQFEERLAERTRIAQELHDTLLQGFLSASMQLHVAVDALPADLAERPRFARVLELMGQVIEEGRNALRGFRKPAPQAWGSDDLGQALSQIPRELGNPEGTGFRVLVEGHPRPLHPVLRDEVYRIGREALVNAFRHAGATEIGVEIEYTPKALRVLVRDDGKGIDPEVLRSGREGHWGLSGMRERAETMGARLKLWSRAGAGTEVELSVPGRIAFAAEPAGRKRRRPRWLRGLRR